MFSDDLMQEAEKDIELYRNSKNFYFFIFIYFLSSLSYEPRVFDISIQIIQEDFGSHTPHWGDKSATIEVSDVHMIYGLIAKA